MTKTITFETLSKVKWDNVKRVFIGTVVFCEPCKSEGFLKCTVYIIVQALKKGFTVVLGSASIGDKELDEASEAMKRHSSFAWPYIRVWYKNCKAQTYTGFV